jgi:hypothetical protein
MPLRGSTTAIVALMLAASPPTAAAAPPAPEPLDLDALATQSKTVEIAEDQLRDTLVSGSPRSVAFSTALDLGGGVTAIAWSECTKLRCRGWVATLTGGTERPALASKAALVAPPKVLFADGFSFEAPAFADLDGDGAFEVVLHYRAAEPPRAALGSLSHEYIAVYSPKNLSLIFSHELARTGGDSEDACRWTLGVTGERLIASSECNARACLDAAAPAAGCKPSRKLVETWSKPRGQKRYTRVANRRAPPAVSAPTAASQ